MRIDSSLLVLCAASMSLGLAVSEAPAGVIFEQDFSSSSTVSSYVSATPNSGQFDDISADGTINTVAVSGGELVFDMNSSGSSGFLRSTDLASPVPTVLAYEMVFTYARNGSETSGPGPILQIGNYPASATGYTGGGSAYDRFDDLTFRRTGSDFQLELNDTDPVTGGHQGVLRDLAFGQEHTILYLLNNSGSNQSYTGPDGVSRTLNSGSSTLFVNGLLGVDNSVADDNGGVNINLSTMRFRAVDSDNTIRIDSIRISDTLPVPEPASLALVGLGLAMVFRRERR